MESTANLAEFLTRRTVVLMDGAMDTQLAAAGLEMGGQNCACHPDAVVAVHNAYADAGSEILISNTLTMNRVFIETHSVGVDVQDVNIAGARLVKSAASEGRYALGDMSSTGQMLEPYGGYSEEQFLDTFREQAEHLLAGGVDGFIIETMMDVREALCALRACRDVSSLPVLVTLAFGTADNGGRTLMGNSAKEGAAALVEAGATAIGANCGDLDPHETALVVGMMRDRLGANARRPPHKLATSSVPKIGVGAHGGAVTNFTPMTGGGRDAWTPEVEAWTSTGRC